MNIINSSPPPWLLRFFRWFCNPEYVEDIEGDLLERYERNVKAKGIGPGKWRLLFDIIKLMRPGIIRPLTTLFYINQLSMFKTNLKVSIRTLSKHRTYVAINLLGMGFALACCIVSFLNLDYKLRFDEHHQAFSENIYRVNTTRITENGTEQWGITPSALAQPLSNEVSGVQEVIRIDNFGGLVVANNKTFEAKIHSADFSVLHYFNFPFLYGDRSTIQDPASVVLSETMALKLFGDDNPIGKSLVLPNIRGQEAVYTVNGVLKKIPENSSLLFDVLVPFANNDSQNQIKTADWRDPSQITIFIVSTSNQSITQFNEQLESYAEIHNEVREDFQVANFYVQPFNELAFSSDIDLPGWVRGRALNRNPVGFLVGITTILSIIILFTACFNFTNTSIAFASNRLKEIGIRKVIGGGRFQLIGQLMIENILLCSASIVIGLVAASYLIDGFNGMFEQQLDMRYIFKSRVIIFMLCLPLMVAILAGTYPAMRITRYQPVEVLKGTSRFVKIGRLSKVLLIGQFSFSCFALLVTLILTQNANYQNGLNLGYDVKKMAVTSIKNKSDFETFKNELIKHPNVKSVAGSAQIVGRSNEVIVKRDPAAPAMVVRQLGIGPEYLKTSGIDLLAGRYFYNNSHQDVEQAVIINESLAKQLEMPSPLNQQLTIDEKMYVIIGVVKNHLEYGLTAAAPPCLFKAVEPEQFQYLTIATNEIGIWDFFPEIQKLWFSINPNQPYNGFLQQSLLFKQFRINEILRNFALLLAVATMIMSAAGFFSLVSLSVFKRTKEIGVRKVFGASLVQLVNILLKKFFKYLLIAFGLGSILGLALINQVLFSMFYAYHVPIGLGAFAIALFIMFLVPGLTIGYKVYVAANANPAKTLKHD